MIQAPHQNPAAAPPQAAGEPFSPPGLSPEKKRRDRAADALMAVMLSMRFVIPAYMLWLTYKAFTR